MSAKKEIFFILLIWSSVSAAVLSLKLLFSGFDTTRFQIFLFLDICQFFTFSSFVTLSHYFISHITLLAFQKKHNWLIDNKILNDIDYRFNGLDTSFLKKLIEFFLNLSLTVIFTLSFRSYEISCIVIGFIGFSWTNRWADILILVDSWWLSWFWKKSFSKTKKKNFNFAILFFLFIFLLPNLVS